MDLPNNKNPLAATQNVPAVSHAEGDLTQYAQRPIEMLFPMPYGRKDGIVKPLLCDISKHCYENNISPENIPVVSITVLTLYSVKLGYPMAIILKADDPMVIQHLLTVCKQITPKRLFIEVQQLSSKQLYRNHGDFMNKTIICPSAKGCKDAVKDLGSLISTEKSYRQELFKSNFGDEYKEVCIQGPIGFIGVEIGDEKFDLNDPSILRITLSADENQTGLTVPKSGYFQQIHGERSAETLRIRRQLERLSHRTVSLPYEEQISYNFTKQLVEKNEIKFRAVRNLLSLLSITNNPPPFTEEEALRYCIGQNPDEIYPVVTSGPVITATKVEYAIMALLLKGIIPIRDEHYTRIQIIIFEAVKMINFGKLDSSTIDQRDIMQVLTTLYKGSAYWAKPVEIFAKSNSRGGKLISIQVIDRELNKLKKLGIITKRKFPKTSDYGYYINNTSIGKHVTFQSPSMIRDPKFNLARVQVVDILSGKIETI